MSIKCGIVGLPNVGKSTLFNALTRAQIAAENYPFCTIDPNVGVVPVPDPRLAQINKHIKTQKIIQHPDVRARVAAVDDRLGIVLLYLDFGNTKQYGPGRALVTFEAFKVYGGQLHAVNAILHMASATAGSGWDPKSP